jgi:uncharacterized protein YciI
MLFILKFTNKPNTASLVTQHYPAHVQWLKERESTVLVPGALRADADSAPVGGLWIIKADSRAEVEKLFQTDPFWVNGLRESYEIFHWSKAFPDKSVSI